MTRLISVAEISKSLRDKLDPLFYFVPYSAPIICNVNVDDKVNKEPRKMSIAKRNPTFINDSRNEAMSVSKNQPDFFLDPSLIGSLVNVTYFAIDMLRGLLLVSRIYI